MLYYTHSRTEQIVERLRRVELYLRTAMILLFTLLGGSAGLGLGITIPAIGAALGFVVSWLFVIPMTTFIDWMCQMLIALGQIVSHTQSAEKP